MLKKTSAIMLVFVLMCISYGCKEKTQVKGIELNVTFAEEQLSDHLITDMMLGWKTGPEFQKMNQDLQVFVHFWHEGNLLFQEDYFPEPPTSQWEPEQEFMRSQRIYIPQFIDEFDPDFKGEETLRLVVGFFSPYDRSGKSEQKVLEKKLTVVPPPLDTPEIIYEEGWYNLEINTDAFLKQWQWTAKEARCIIDNPHRDALLVIKGGVNLEVLDDQKVTFKINELVLDEFIPEESHFEKSYNVKKEMLGEGEEFYLSIVTDKVFVPAEVMPNSADQRELGVQVSFIYFR
ncbi:MAG: hypothetical protein KAT01_12610 [Candidatus Aminicenantes bacterium]|nr:hypothetical protein [Candidatus Aminicenantes bacterium]